MEENRVKNNTNQFVMDSASGARIIIDGKEYSFFAGTSYFELHKHEAVIKSAADAIMRYGITSASSRNSYGTTQLLLDLEIEAARFFDTEDAVYIPSGYLSDLAAIPALNITNPFDIILIDEVAHYSNQHAIKLSGKPVYTFSHMDADDLQNKLSANLKKNQTPLIITDGIFPISGEIAPIDLYEKIASRYNGIIWVDDAHAMGILGATGRGTIEHYGLNSERIFFGGTFSKAFGAFGGIIPASKKLVYEIKNNHILNGATPAPSAAMAASLTGMRLVKENPQFRKSLWENAKYLKEELKKMGIDTDDTVVPIVSWGMQNKDMMQKLHKELMDKGIVIQYINYMGSGDNGVLRIVVFSTHTKEQIQNLVYELNRII